MKAIDLIFRETLTAGQFEMKSHVLVFIDEAGDEWEEFYNETVAKVAQAILEAEQIKEA